MTTGVPAMTADRERAKAHATILGDLNISSEQLRNLARAHIEVSEELSDARLEISSLKDAERTDLAELTRLGEENERLVKALAEHGLLNAPALRWQGEAVAPVRIHAMTADDRVVRVLAEHPVVMTVAGELTRFLKEQEAANYIELRLTDANDGQEYALLIQRVGGETPAQQAQRLKDELATLTHPVPSQQGGFGAAALAEVAAGCPCLRCIRERGDKSGGLPLEYTMMIVCVICGNKRCPHSDDHRNPCTNSNEPGQHGSRYGGLAAPSPKKQEE